MRTLFLAAIMAVSFMSSFANARRPPPYGYVCGRNAPAPEGPSCVSVACDLLGGTRACDSDSELAEVERACIDNASGSCLAQSCRILGQRECGDIEAIGSLAASCQGTCDLSCTQVGCDEIGCRNTYDLAAVNLACSGQVSGSCVKQECGGPGCGSLADLQKATRACGGVM
jgi:hypothetical protein